MKKRMALLLFLSISSLLLCSFQTFRQETGQGHAGVTSAQTPINMEKGGTIWTRSFPSQDGSFSYNSDPILSGSHLYIVNNNTLYELNKKDGSILRTRELSSRTDSVCHMLLEGSRLFIPLSGGKIECVDIRHMVSLWQSEAFGGQSLSTLFYHEDALYAGTVNMISGNDCTGIFYCLDADDGHTRWIYEDTENPGGYYWSGAIVCQGTLYFTGDNGILVSHSLTTQEVYDTCTLTDTSRIRSGLTYDTDTASLYTASTDGQVYRIPLSEDGSIQKDAICSGPVVPTASLLNCTSTPTIYNGRLYIGCIADSYGHLSILNAESLALIYTVKGQLGAEIKSSPLVSDGYATRDNHTRVYVYVSANRPPGGIYCLMDDTTRTDGVLTTLFTPAVAKQYCLSSMISDEEGTLYYSNDSSTVFAVSEVDVSSDLPPANTISPSPVPDDHGQKETNTKQKYTPSPIRVKKPVNIKWKRSGRKIHLSWKKKTKKSQTILYIQYGKGKWEKKILRTRTKCSIMRKKKTVRLRLRSRIRIGSKWIYSGYSKTYRIKKGAS